MNKQELEDLLHYHDDLYYNKDDPQLTDEEYDALKNQYVSQYGEYDYVPGEASADAIKYNHTTNVSSLDKLRIDQEEEIRKTLKRLWPVIIQPKFDGLTVVTYPDGTHVTRGNGSVGEDITEKVNAGVIGIGDVMDRPVRSEVVMLKSEFERINQKRIKAGLKPFKNVRNAAAGMLRRNEVTKIEGLVAYAYNIIYEEAEDNCNLDQIQDLQDAGWNISPTFIPDSIDQAMDYLKGFDRDELDYEIDGLVIKHNGEGVFGYTGHHPKSAMAIKFASQGQWTTLKEIKWQVGRTGKITPVGIFRSVNLLGASVNRATLYNMGIIKALGLEHLYYRGKHEECCTEVYVIKSNDVIPVITKVKQPPLSEGPYVSMVREPHECPVCGGQVRKNNDQLYCINTECPARIVARLVHMADRDAFNIRDLSDKTAEKLVSLYKSKVMARIKEMSKADAVTKMTAAYREQLDATCAKLTAIHPTFIYDFTLEDFIHLEGFGKKSGTNLYRNIRNSLSIDMDKFLYGAGIPLIGKKASKDIAMFYYNEEEPAIIAFARDYLNNFERLKDVPGIGDEMLSSLINNYETMLVPFGDYPFEVRDVKPKATKKDHKTFVITGEFEMKRKFIISMIEEAGHKVTGTVSSKTDYLLASPGEEGTEKYKKAKSLGSVSILHSIEELMELL